MTTLLSLLVLAPAHAQDTDDDGVDDTIERSNDDDADATITRDGGDDVEDTVDPDPKPTAPRPDVELRDPKVYAGVGSNIAYASGGITEASGSIAFSASPGSTTFSADPSIGYFLLDNVQLSGIVGLRHTVVEGDTSSRFSFLAEPSLHFPINDGLFWAGGLGMGVAVTDGLGGGDGVTAGFALAPRTGLQLLVGRSGIMNLGVRYSMIFSDVEADVGPAAGQAVLTFVNTFDAQVGYTVMF